MISTFFCKIFVSVLPLLRLFMCDTLHMRVCGSARRFRKRRFTEGMVAAAADCSHEDSIASNQVLCTDPFDTRVMLLALLHFRVEMLMRVPPVQGTCAFERSSIRRRVLGSARGSILFLWLEFVCVDSGFCRLPAPSAQC